MENAANIFDQGEKQDPELNVKDLHAKIGQLAVENDFLSNALGRIDGPSAKR
jgi:transposase